MRDLEDAFQGINEKRTILRTRETDDNMEDYIKMDQQVFRNLGP